MIEDQQHSFSEILNQVNLVKKAIHEFQDKLLKRKLKNGFEGTVQVAKSCNNLVAARDTLTAAFADIKTKIITPLSSYSSSNPKVYLELQFLNNHLKKISNAVGNLPNTAEHDPKAQQTNRIVKWMYKHSHILMIVNGVLLASTFFTAAIVTVLSIELASFFWGAAAVFFANVPLTAAAMIAAEESPAVKPTLRRYLPAFLTAASLALTILHAPVYEFMAIAAPLSFLAYFVITVYQVVLEKHYDRLVGERQYRTALFSDSDKLERACDFLAKDENMQKLTSTAGIPSEVSLSRTNTASSIYTMSINGDVDLGDDEDEDAALLLKGSRRNSYGATTFH